jgi:Prealbumin-like fold domain
VGPDPAEHHLALGEPGGLVHRTAGDLLIVYDFEGGSGDEPVLTLRRWVTSGACEVNTNTAPCWGPATNLTAGGFAEAKVNTTASVTDLLTPPALSSTTGTSVSSTLGLNEFGEAGIDLTGAGVFTAGSCESFGNAFGVSRTSGSSATAQMKDLVGPAPFTLQNCGAITIIKRTNPRGVDQDFDFTSTIAGSQLQCTADATPASFTLNDDAGVDNADNTESCINVPAGSYTVTEGADPTGFAFESLTCTATGTGTSATTSGKVASITIAGGGAVTCVYVNRQELGAIKVTKTRKHAADGPGDHPHAGVSFTVNGVTKVTDANDVACFDGLAFGTYTVTETVPAGYSVDLNPKSATVDNNAQCSDDPYGGETVSFHNTPLTDLTVSINSQVDGGTASTVSCTNGGPSGSTGPNGDGSFTQTNLAPNTYVCTVVIDP